MNSDKYLEGQSIWKKFTAIEESKDLSSLSLEELISNLKVHEMIMEKDFELVKGKGEKINYLALKAKKKSSDDKTLMFESEDEEYDMAVSDFKKLFKRRGANKRPPMLKKWNYIPWESRFRSFLVNKLEEGDKMWRSIEKGPYVRPMIPNPDNTNEHILEQLSKMTEGNKEQYTADVKEQIKRLMFGSDVKNHVRHSRLMDEFDKFAAKEGESLESVYERLTNLVNILDRNNVRPIPVSIKTKFLNCLQTEWSKYVTMSYVNPSSSHSPQPYYVTHPSSVVDYKEDYQGELQGDSQEDKLTTAMMLLARAITPEVLNTYQ
ncbi:hypothetical protein Tco_0047650 [Tanacetum coccineum]